MNRVKTYEELLVENEELRGQLEEAVDTIEAIRTGQVDALVVKGEDGHQIFALKTADQTYRVFIEKMNEGALTLNEAGVILYCNSMFAEMVGTPLSKALGQTFSSFIPADYQGEYELLFKNGWSADAKLELQINGAKGLIPCQLSVTTIQLDEGMALSIILTDLSYQKDVQELLEANNKRLEETNAALEKSNYDLQQFASVASHDLQEPLRKMLIFSNMLKAKLGKDIGDDATTYLDKVLTSSYRMKRLISDILSFTRIGVEQLDFSPADLHEVVLEILDDFEIVIKEKSAIIELDKLPVIEVSRAQIRQLFQNLISNSLKFSRPGIPPHIRITSEHINDETHCAITVADNGIGFDPQYSDQIFSLFQRLNTKDTYEGSGIGLAVARKIVEGHNGKIFVTSVENEGSQFKVVLPCVHTANS